LVPLCVVNGFQVVVGVFSVVAGTRSAVIVTPSESDAGITFYEV
jgi:hypothetical protein